MKIILYAKDETSAWIDAFRLALPGARIEPWSETVAAEADYAIVWKPPRGLMQGLRQARAVFNLGAGIDSIPDLDELPTGIPLVRLEDAGMAEQMVEYVCHAVLRRYRELDAYAELQGEALWRPRPRKVKRDFAIGILGAGVLGAAVAEALVRFGFPIRVWSRTPKQIAGAESFAGERELDRFLSDALFLVCLLPLTRETENLLDRARLLRLKRGAYVVNVARGGLLVDSDLLSLIDEGHLAGAMLDVFREEPLPRAHPFWHHRRIVLTPHVSAATLVQASVDQIADKIRRLETRSPITGVVDRDRGY